MLSSKALEKVVRTSVFRTTRKVRTQVSRDVREVYAVKAGLIAKSVTIENGPSFREKLLLYKGSNLPLTEFKPLSKRVRSAKGPRRGVTVRVRKDRGRRLVKGGFLATLDGDRMVAKRLDDRRFPIRQRYSISIPGMVKQRDVLKKVTRFVEQDYPAEVNRQMSAQLKGFNRGRS